MKDIKIIEYRPMYAKSIAEMWQKSADGWGGKYSDMTEEKVLREIEGSSSINIYLAEKNGEIIGYLDLGQYIQDEGALEIKLLNTRYDYHGLGIGKALVFKSIERTVELGWPRLDLITWSGNEKSIPLYKKCGFFFVEGGDIIYLMNFLPYVISTEALKQSFSSIDWYKDLKKKIDMEPDGRKEDGFCFYEYHWEKEGQLLKVEFEKSGRGLRLIETEDYSIEAKLPYHKLVFGQKHTMEFIVVNKSGKELNIEFKGVSNNGIDFSFTTSRIIQGKEVIEGGFYIREDIGEAIDSKTHPVVAADVSINGKSARFKLGISPKAPASIRLRGTDSPPILNNREVYKNVVTDMYLNIENNITEEVEFRFSLLDNHDIHFLNRTIEISMSPQEQKFIKIGCIVKNHCLYSEDISVTAHLKSGGQIFFNSKLTGVFRGRDGCFGGEERDYYIIVNGKYSAKLSKLNNRIYLRSSEYENNYEPFRVTFNFPKLGKPYRSEISSTKPREVIWYREEDSIILKAIYDLQSNNVDIETIIKISSAGLVEQYHNVINNSKTNYIEDLGIQQGFYQQLNNGVIPINNKIVKISNPQHEDIRVFSMENLTENWIFANTDQITRGLWWGRNLKPKLDEWFISFEHHINSIPPQGIYTTPSLRRALDVFKDWREFRDFVQGDNSSGYLNPVDSLEMRINDGNPFVKEALRIRLLQHSKSQLEGNLNISWSKAGIDKKFNIIDDSGIGQVEFSLDYNKKPPMDLLQLEIDGEASISQKSAVVFKVEDSPLVESIIKENGWAVFSIENGPLKIKLSPHFSPGIYSMTYKGNEYIESSFPSPTSKSWYNPWTGGILTAPEALDMRSLLKEKVVAEFTSTVDSCGNNWRGIKARIKVVNDHSYKGLEITQYFLLLPGSPVLCHTVEVTQGEANYFNDELFEGKNFFCINGDLKQSYLEYKNTNGCMEKHKLGTSLVTLNGKQTFALSKRGIEDKVQIFSDFSMIKPWFALNKLDGACFMFESIRLAPKERKFTTPVFYIFTDDFIDESILEDFKNIRFN